MTMESFATPYPVIFHDGETEHDKGHIGIHSVLPFKRFQSQVSRLIGVPANHLSTVFVCRRTLKDTEKRQKLPINETTNFNIILNQHNPSREKDCYFLVSIKKSKKDRKGTRKRNSEADNVDDEDSTSSRGGVSPSDERPHPGIAMDKTFSSEATSPTSILQRPVSPALSASETVNEQTNLEAPCNTKNDAGSADMLERMALRREGVGQKRIVSPRLAWPGQRVEGFDVNLVSKGEILLSSQSESAPAAMQDEHWKAEKAWIQEGIAGRPFDMMALQAMQPPLMMPSAFRPRFFDSSRPQGFGARSVTPLQRFGNMNLQPSFPDIPSRPIFSSFQSSGNGNLIPRNATHPPMPLNANTGFHQAQMQHSLMMQTQTPFKPIPVIAASPRAPKFIGRDYGLTQVSTDLRVDAERCTYHCEFCSSKNQGSTPPFHFCVNDRTISGRRGPSPAGPIARPSQRLVEAAGYS